MFAKSCVIGRYFPSSTALPLVKLVNYLVLGEPARIMSVSLRRRLAFAGLAAHPGVGILTLTDNVVRLVLRRVS